MIFSKETKINGFNYNNYTAINCVLINGYSNISMDYQNNLRVLKKTFEKGEKFTLYIGAGVNAGKNIKLLWANLIGEACDYAFRQIGDKLNLKSSDTKQLLSLLGIQPIDWDNNTIFEDQILTKQIFNDFTKLKDYITTHLPIEIQVSIIKTLVGDVYIPLLQNYLYTQCNKNKIRRYFENYRLENVKHACKDDLYTLFVTARMILLNPQIQNVVSYNYDNFLTYAVCYLLHNSDKFFTEEERTFLRQRYGLSEQDSFEFILPIKDIGKDALLPNEGDWRTVPVYHVHGYIPSPDELQYIDAPSIVLSMDEYCATLREQSTWRIVSQENFILSSNSLFIGSSLTDLTTKRLLNLASNNQAYKVFMLDAYNNTESDKFNLETAKRIFREIRDNYLTSLGVNVIDCQSGFTDLFTEIAKITDSRITGFTS